MPPGSPLADPDFVAGLRSIPSTTGDGPAPWPATDLVGLTPSGQPVTVAVDHFDQLVLLAFLALRCDGCEGFWRGFADLGSSGLPSTVSAVIVTRGPDTVDRGEVERLSDGVGVPVVMSDRAWADYRVTGYPFFVAVEPGGRRVVGETVGFGWSDVVAMVASSRA